MQCARCAVCSVRVWNGGAARVGRWLQCVVFAVFLCLLYRAFPERCVLCALYDERGVWPPGSDMIRRHTADRPAFSRKPRAFPTLCPQRGSLSSLIDAVRPFRCWVSILSGVSAHCLQFDASTFAVASFRIACPGLCLLTLWRRSLRLVSLFQCVLAVEKIERVASVYKRQRVRERGKKGLALFVAFRFVALSAFLFGDRCGRKRAAQCRPFYSV